MATLGSDSASVRDSASPGATEGAASGGEATPGACFQARITAPGADGTGGSGAQTRLEQLQPGSSWRLGRSLDAYSSPRGPGLATQVRAGRSLRVLEYPQRVPVGAAWRLRVRLLEDGYPCWLEVSELLAAADPAAPPARRAWNRHGIEAQLQGVLTYGLAALQRPNRYLWGGSLGPDYDCSGLVQAAYAQAGIWLPRDAYLQERFCQPVAVQVGQISLLQPGDLLFFGTPRRCSHVGLHLGEGRYLHSSGRQHGRDGLGIDDLHPRNRDAVACHYRAELRGAGRVMHSHDGSPLPP